MVYVWWNLLHAIPSTDTLFHYTDSAMHSAKLPPINSRQISFLHYHRSQLFFQPKHLDCDAKEWREGTQHWILNESLCGCALCASAWIERITTVRPKRVIWCQLKVNICMTTDGDVVSASARRKRKRLRERHVLWMQKKNVIRNGPPWISVHAVQMNSRRNYIIFIFSWCF